MFYFLSLFFFFFFTKNGVNHIREDRYVKQTKQRASNLAGRSRGCIRDTELRGVERVRGEEGVAAYGYIIESKLALSDYKDR